MLRVNASFLVPLLFAAVAAPPVPAAPPTCTTHFFDWYVVSDKAPLQEQQKRWTYRVDWGALGIAPEEIGNTAHYYEAHFRKIRDGGFDGLHYEWHCNNPKPQFLDALRTVRLPIAMFYDMEIRFAGRGEFITPTADFAKQFVADVVSFYRSVPRELWLHDRNGKLPIVVYGYAFDRKITDPAPWHRFYQAIIQGIEGELNEPVVFHWTNNGSPQQLYGFQHFAPIQSYVFNEAMAQSQINARSVTFVVHYDDLGVSFARKGERPARWIRNDIRYLQESLWLAEHSDPDLVFNYGWSELYEGEHLMPDALWGNWRYEVASAMVKHIKQHTAADLPRVLVIADDILPAFHRADPATRAILQHEMDLLAAVRAVVPRAEVILTGEKRDLRQYAAIFAVNLFKNAGEDASLAACGRPVVYTLADPALHTAVSQQFTAKTRRPLFDPARGPSNEFAVATRALKVDLDRFPILEFRLRNSPASMFHIRYYGLNGKGQEVPVWCETSPTDDRDSQGQWLDGKANIAEIARRATGEPIHTLTRMEVLLDDLEDNGRLTLDIDYLRFVSTAGQVGWSEPFDIARDWTVGASFTQAAGQPSRYSFATMQENGKPLQRMTLRAVISDKRVPPVDASTQRIEPSAGVQCLVEAAIEEAKIPILLNRGDLYWLNTCTPSDRCWQVLLPKLTGTPLHTGVLFRSFSHSQRPDGLHSDRAQALMAIREQRLPIRRVRLVAPPELDQPLPHTLPEGWRSASLQIVRGARQTIPFPAPGIEPPSILLQPGEVVEFVTADP